MAGKHSARRSRQKKSRRTVPYSWLGAGVIGLGVGAALASGAGIAYADDASDSPGPTTSSASSPGERATSATGSTSESAQHPSRGHKRSKSRDNDDPTDASDSPSSSPIADDSSDTEDVAPQDADKTAEPKGSSPAPGDTTDSEDALLEVGDGDYRLEADQSAYHLVSESVSSNKKSDDTTADTPTQVLVATALSPGGSVSLAAAPPESIPTTVQPIVPPGSLGSYADLPYPSWVHGSSWYTGSPNGFEQVARVSTFNDEQYLGVYKGEVTRPIDDPDPRAVYVVEVLDDYLRYWDPVALRIPPEKRDILSMTRLNPGETISVQERRVTIYHYPEGWGNTDPSTYNSTIADQITNLFIVWMDEDTTAPTAPNITTTHRTTTTVDLKISGGTDDVGIVAYEIFRNGGLIRIVGVEDPDLGATYTDTLLDPATTYLYTARARDLAGNESPDSEPPLSVTTNVDPDAPPDVTPPTAPDIASTDRTVETVELVVSGATDDVGVVAYKIFRDGSFLTIVSPGEKFTDTLLSAATSYTYTARARDLAGNESPDSASLVVTTLGAPILDVSAPSAPNITTTDRTTTTVDLLVSGGEDNIGIVAYKIFRDGALITIVNVGQAYTDTGLVSEATYRYTARAVDAAGNESLDSTPPLIVTTNTDPSPGLNYGCDSTHSCPPPNGKTETFLEDLSDFVDRFTFSLTATNPVLGYLFDITVGTYVGILNTAFDILQNLAAIARGDSTDIHDEVDDLISDLVGTIPGSSIVHGGLLLDGHEWPWL
ncbi:hypothetical protein [Mycobacterium sp. 236(2023)]|uniref:fibronectin type III domain-containing protein n=1 Tax=Mycobacterium sp. 236(2023) TaxID=3038163 RepID=UPI002414DD09|nr:hypothetical protein [Mycobacterium sp. 236(2023)]MDG4668631.1 hypothetical protein [Mycobacterium sp. 236(2023)]